MSFMTNMYDDNGGKTCKLQVKCGGLSFIIRLIYCNNVIPKQYN